MALKGTNKCLSEPPMKYKRVLETTQPYEGQNRGFRFYGNEMRTYEQYKNSITFFYCKTNVLDDGITTLPLDV